ncbi:hypothetical protein NPIL_314341 [Nephila pilipes]|uniref:Uncharacterized protein n=1 Tax=Nephila pilipes TaxID=299642 RepID=A0A8X6IMN0_NEPPI|nr:hypothetical protein NPIL_314341 [Nephila pilipes]
MSAIKEKEPIDSAIVSQFCYKGKSGCRVIYRSRLPPMKAIPVYKRIHQELRDVIQKGKCIRPLYCNRQSSTRTHRALDVEKDDVSF